MQYARRQVEIIKTVRGKRKRANVRCCRGCALMLLTVLLEVGGGWPMTTTKQMVAERLAS